LILFFKRRPSHKELNKKIKQAKEVVSKRNINFIKKATIEAELLNFDILIDEFIPILLNLLNEITPDDYAGHRPPQKSYEDEIDNCDLFVFVWKSVKLKREIYLKFTIKDDLLWLINFHEERKILGE
jgi:hypothetical protein